MRLRPPAGWCFRAPAWGEFTALDAATGAPLWSSQAQTGIMAAPISYEVGGKQYVAIMVGSGGSWGMIGGDANIKGNNLPNISRLLVFGLGGTAKVASGSAAPRNERCHHRRRQRVRQRSVLGAAAFGAYCGNCHGAGAISLGILPDLRYSKALHSADTWRSIVVDGTLEDSGMASFATVVDAKSAEAIRACNRAGERDEVGSLGCLGSLGRAPFQGCHRRNNRSLICRS